MSGWPHSSNNGAYMQDANSSQNLMNPSMASLYSSNHNNNQFDVSQFQNNPLQQGMQNGSVNPQTAFGNQTYNVNSVVPSKRPRPSEDGSMAASPHLPSNTLNASRAQTPMQNSPYLGGFQQPGQQGGQQFQAPTPYQHLQHAGSANATPSPTMQNQHFRPPQQQQQQQQQQPPQRMSTASPATFNQTSQNMATAMSPAQSNQSSTPNMMQPGQGQNFAQAQGFGQNMGGASAAMSIGMPGAGTMNMAANPQLQQQYQQRLYAQRLQQAQQKMQSNNPAGARPMSNGQQAAMFNNTGQQPGQGMSNGQMPGQSAQAAGVANAQKQEQWLRGVAHHLQQQGKPFNPQPTVSGRPLNLFVLWYIVLQAGGSQRVTAQNTWPIVAQKLQIHPQQFPSAPQEIRQTFENVLGTYERVYLQMQMQKRQQQAQMQARQMAGLGNAGQASPPRPAADQMNSQQQAMMHAMQQKAQQQTSAQANNQQGQQGTPMQRPAALPSTNGVATPQAAMAGLLQHQQVQQQQNLLNEQRRSSSLSKIEALPPQEVQPSKPSASPAPKLKPETPVADRPAVVKREASTASVKQVIEQSTEYEVSKRSIHENFYGGYEMVPLAKLGGDIVKYAPDVPGIGAVNDITEMGVIDIRALTLSLQSGIHGEVRYALDHLAVLSANQSVTLDLEQCEDLVDVIVDCAEEQLDALAEDAAEVSDGLDLLAYEDVVRACRAEEEKLQSVPRRGTPAHDLEMAADRLISLLTLLRNLSFFEINHRLLSSNAVFGLISNAIRLLGTRNMLLRTFHNVADFYKDVINFLSNVASVVEFQSRDDALHILQFILAFAPHPSPRISSEPQLRFNPYVPLLQRYLPFAVDSLAKLLARQEPNRSLYRSIFTSSQNQNSSETASPADLLTCAFGLSISVLPERSKRVLSTQTELRTVEARKATLTQGMLAADILASMVPASSHSDDAADSDNLPRAWLESEDRWAGGLLRMAYVLSTDRGNAQLQAQRGGHMPLLEPDHQGYALITHRGLGMLVRLVEKAGNMRRSKRSRSAEDSDYQDSPTEGGAEEVPKWILKSNAAPRRETVIGALVLQDADKVSLRLLCELYGMAS